MSFYAKPDRDDFKYVVPDFRLNKTFDRLLGEYDMQAKGQSGVFV